MCVRLVCLCACKIDDQFYKSSNGILHFCNVICKKIFYKRMKAKKTKQNTHYFLIKKKDMKT